MAKKFLTYGDRGDRVRKLQSDINNNEYHHLVRRLSMDGEFGPSTASAVHNIKYWLGYPELDPDLKDQIAGKFLFDVLEHDRALPPAFKKTRVARTKAWEERRKKLTIADRALMAAKEDLGIREKQPNIIKYNEWWNGQKDHAPYCVRAGSYWNAKGGSKVIDPKKSLFEGTDYFLECAKKGEFGLHLTSDPGPGFSFVIDFNGKSDPDHFGLYVGDNGGGYFRSIEANATLSDGSQGVGYHVRAYRNCWFVEFTK